MLRYPKGRGQLGPVQEYLEQASTHLPMLRAWVSLAHLWISSHFTYYKFYALLWLSDSNSGGANPQISYITIVDQEIISQGWL